MAEAMPDISADLNAAKTKYTGAWLKCLAAGDDGSWIRLVARDLNAKDPRFGLNAKRDGPSNDISKDCIAYRVFEPGDPANDRLVEVYDVIGNHELPNASIVRINQTNYSTIGNPGTARFVHPVTGGGYQGALPTPNPGPTPMPEPTYTVQEAINYLTSKKGSLLTSNEANDAVHRAQELGWDGGPNIKQSIVHQIAAEFWPGQTKTIECTVISGPYPPGTKLTIKIG